MFDRACGQCGKIFSISPGRHKRQGARLIFCGHPCRSTYLAAKAKLPFTPDLVRSLINYDPETGVFTWNEPRVHCRSGDVAGRIIDRGYRVIMLREKNQMAHKLAWFITYNEWPKEIDHINGDRSDNRIENLRLVTRSQNNANALQNRNKHGLQGVVFRKSRGVWSAQITVRGKHRAWGYFRTPELAHEAYRAAHIEAFGEHSVYSRKAP